MRLRTARLPSLLAFSTLILTASAFADPASLKDVWRDSFQVGTAVPARSAFSEAERALLAAQFSSVTPENLMKPIGLQPEEGRFTFDEADRFVADAEAAGQTVHGHTLIWHTSCPDWFFKDGANRASKELVLSRVRTHVDTVVRRYQGRIARWDVVNEAIDDGPRFLRENQWQQATGEDYLVEAFRAARAADPQARLYYNDYGIERGDKRDKALRLIRLLRERGVTVHGIGIQGHWSLRNLPLAEIDVAIQMFSDEGLEVAITELDMDVVERRTSGADVSASEAGSDDPFRTGLPEDVQQRQAELYGRLFALLKSHSASLSVVTFWGLNDAHTWLNYWPRRRTNHPLLWDRQSQAKPAFESVVQAAKNESTASP